MEGGDDLTGPGARVTPGRPSLTALALALLPYTAHMEFRALAFDLDGTLLDRQERVPPRNLAAVRAAMAAGYTVIVASARWRALAQKIADDVGTLAPIVCCSGAEVWSQAAGRDLLDLRLPEAFATALYALCDENRCVATVAVDEDVVVKMDGQPDLASMPVGMRWVPSLTRGVPARPRIALIQGTDTVQLIEDSLREEWGEAVRFVESFSSHGKRILTLTAAGADKGVALGVACAELGIPVQSVIAFGDAENDIEMFRVAGAAVAMGQASDHVKGHATFVTAPNSEDGVAVAVERLLANGRL